MREKVYTALFFTFLFCVSFSFYKVEASETQLVEKEVCGEGRFKSFMSMTKLGRNTPQYKYLKNNTKDENNLRVTSDGYYAVAMGSYYGKLGDKFVITFESGKTVKVVKVDEKANIHTSSKCKGKTMASDGSIIEPIVSYGVKGERSKASNKKLYDKMFLHGNIGMAYPEQFAKKEKIIKIQKVEQKPVQEVKEEKRDPIFLTLYFIENGGVKSVYVYIPNEPHQKIVFMDTEFTGEQDLVQAAFITFSRVGGKEYFFLTSSLNVYVNRPVEESFENYTGIKQGFLGNEGIPIPYARDQINQYIKDNNIDLNSTLIVGHGLKQDLLVLKKFGVDLKTVNKYDTFENARSLLGRTSNLKLSDLLFEAGFYQGSAHDAYQDARNLIPVYGHLKILEEKKKYEKV